MGDQSCSLREREGRGSRVYPPSILLTSSPSYLKRTSEERTKDVYCQSEPFCWISICDEPGQVISQTSGPSFSIVKTISRGRELQDPALQTVCYHEMYCRQRPTVQVSFSRATGSHLPCSHLFLHRHRFPGDSYDERTSWIPPSTSPPQPRKMTETRGLSMRLKLFRNSFCYDPIQFMDVNIIEH